MKTATSVYVQLALVKQTVFVPRPAATAGSRRSVTVAVDVVSGSCHRHQLQPSSKVLSPHAEAAHDLQLPTHATGSDDDRGPLVCSASGRLGSTPLGGALWLAVSQPNKP